MFDGLQKGDELQFTATLVGLGNEFKMHHLHVKELMTTGNRKEIDDITIIESHLPWHALIKQKSKKIDRE